MGFPHTPRGFCFRFPGHPRVELTSSVVLVLDGPLEQIVCTNERLDLSQRAMLAFQEMHPEHLYAGNGNENVFLERERRSHVFSPRKEFILFFFST